MRSIITMVAMSGIATLAAFGAGCTTTKIIVVTPPVQETPTFTPNQQAYVQAVATQMAQPTETPIPTPTQSPAAPAVAAAPEAPASRPVISLTSDRQTYQEGDPATICSTSSQTVTFRVDIQFPDGQVTSTQQGVLLAGQPNCDTGRAELPAGQRTATLHALRPSDGAELATASVSYSVIAAPPTPPVTVRIDGTPGLAFSAIIGCDMGQRSVDGVTPAVFSIPVAKSPAACHAVAGKPEPGSGTLRVTLECPEGARTQETTADLGFASVTCR